MLDICEDAMNDKNMVKNINMSPFSPSKNKRSLSLDSRRGKVSGYLDINFSSRQK